jgi:hypothetical protein
MTQVAFVASGTKGTGTNSSVTPTLPAGVTDGDMLLCLGMIAAPARTYTGPAGWSSTTYFTNTSTNGPRLWCAWKIYASGDTNPTFSPGGTSLAGAGAAAEIFAFRNADPSGPTFGTTYTSGSTTGNNVGPITTVTVNGLGIAVAMAGWSDDYTTGPSQPSGWNNWSNQKTTAATVNVSYGVFDKVLTGASSSVTVSGTPTAAATRAGIQIAIHEQTNLNKLKAGSGNVLLSVGSSAASKAYVGSTQIWP